MKSHIGYFLIVPAFVAGLWAGYSIRPGMRVMPGGDIVCKVLTDTVVVRDTVAVRRPDHIADVALCDEVRYLPLATSDTLTTKSATSSGDSIAVVVPRTQRLYGDSTWQAWVSGYEPELDSIRFVNTHSRVTSTMLVGPTRHRRWTLSVGVGIGMTPRGLQPSAALTVGYTIMTF